MVWFVTMSGYLHQKNLDYPAKPACEEHGTEAAFDRSTFSEVKDALR